jgi:acyl-[acyl-carrier-protein]-phospholipid O-acyltransferase/long-chain-fatty-acid--[acyl-carrier-protein] ligase
LTQGVRSGRYPVSIHFGPPVTAVESVEQVRVAVASLSEKTAPETIAVEERRQAMNLPVAFLKMCRQVGGRSKLADLSSEITGRQLLIKALVLRRILLREILTDDEHCVGLLLPPSVGGAVVNAAVPLCRRVPVNLNYTLSADILNHCIAEADIRHVLTSRRVIEKMNLQIDAELVCLEDFKEKVTLADKLVGAISGIVTPVGLLARQLGVHDLNDEEIFTIIFTSGSTGEPKGVMLTMGNIGSNVAAIDSVVHLHKEDVLLGILPFFHVFGYTATLWTVLTLLPKGIYHFSPLEAREVGKLCGRHKATIVLTTPTFLRGFLRRCEVEQFAAVDVLVTGAERLPTELADAFEKKFGIRPIEGYGTTELSPLSALNIPPSRARENPGEGVREGTIGRSIPGVDAKIVHTETGEDLPPDTEGMLLFRGPNVMKGYLKDPEKTAEVMRDGWYVTGDIAKIDADGFIKITGRESRFSKIGGEMVPHLRIEDGIMELLFGEVDEEHEAEIVVTAIPDTRKGERIIVLYVQLNKTPEEICQGLQQAGLPPIWIPSPESFVQVETIPVLGTGKLDLKAVKELALRKFPS